MIRFLYYKWIKRKCPHFCFLCEYRKTYLDECKRDSKKSKGDNDGKH